jgi:hypothetical protein
MTPQKAVLLVGSPRGHRSASLTLGTRLLSRLAARGFDTEVHSILKAFGRAELEDALLSSALSADVLVVAFPLYVDQLPAAVVRTLDMIAARRRDGSGAMRPRLAALVQCGFPETRHNELALEIMRRFAALNGFVWAGGLAMGMGGAAGQSLPETPTGILRHAVTALDQAAAALAEGRPISPATAAIMGKPLMPKWLYLLVGNLQWRTAARKSARRTGRRADLRARPYAGPLPAGAVHNELTAPRK